MGAGARPGRPRQVNLGLGGGDVKPFGVVAGGEFFGFAEEGEGGGGVGGDLEFAGDLGVVAFPVANDLAVGGLVGDVDGGEVGGELGAEEEVLEAGGVGVGLDAAEAFEEPGFDVSEHEVVVGVGAVPGFGEGGGAFAELSDVAGAVGLGGHVVEGIAFAGVGESADDVGEADVAGGDAVFVVCEGLDEVVQHRAALFVGDETEGEGHGVGGLAGVFVLVGVGVEVFVVEYFFDGLGAGGEIFGIFGFVEEGGDFFEGGEHLVPGGGAGEAFGGELGDAGAFGADVVPVAEAVVDDVVVGGAGEIFFVAFHGVVVVGEDLFVAVEDVGVPGGEDSGGGPFRGIEEVAFEVGEFGGDFGDEAVGVLGVGDVVGDLAVEAGDVPVHHDGVGHEVGLFEPAKFFAVGAVGEDGLGVGEDGVVDEGVDFVEGFVGGGEGAADGEVGVDELGGEGVDDDLGAWGFWLGGGAGLVEDDVGAGDLDVAVAEGGEEGVPVFGAVAGEGVGVPAWAVEGGLRNEAIFEDFAGEEFDGGAGGAGDREVGPAGHVLSEVDDEDAGLGLGDFLGLEGVADPVGGCMAGVSWAGLSAVPGGAISAAGCQALSLKLGWVQPEVSRRAS